MMHETPDDKMFTELLGDYSAPIADNGFSANLMAEVQMQADEARLKAANTRRKIKTYMVGSGAVLGGAIAALQLPALWTYMKSLALPTVTVPTLDLPNVQSSLETQSYTLLAFAMITVLLVWLAGSTVFGEN